MSKRTFTVSFLFFAFLFFYSSIYSWANDAVENSDDPLQQIEKLINTGDKYEFSEPVKALEYYQQAFDLGTEIVNNNRNKNILPQVEILRAKSRRYSGIVHSQLGNYEESLEHYSTAGDILNRVRNLYTAPFQNEVDIKIAKLSNNTGVVYSRMGLFSIAREHYQKALDIYTNLNDSLSIAVVFSSMGIIEARQANLIEALKYFQEALSIYTAIHDVEGMAQSYNNIGGIYFQLQNWDEALRLYKKAYDAFSELQMSHRVAATLGNIGLTYQNLYDFDKALEYLERSLQIREEHKYKGEMVESYNNLGTLYIELEDFEKANFYYKKSYELAQQIGEQRIIALTLINIGKVEFLDNNFNQAIESTKRGLEVAEEYNLNFVVSPALDQLAEIYSAAGNFEDAYRYARRHYKVDQEILDEQKARQINELEIGFQAREKQQQIEILEQENQLNQLKARQSESLVFILALFLILALLVGFFSVLFLRQRNKITLLKKEQEARSVIRKTDNDLKAILKTHAHAMILFDNELNVIAFNNLAKQWAKEFLKLELESGDSFFTSPNAIVIELINGVVSEALKGHSEQIEKEVFSLTQELNYFKFFCNPVFDDSDQSVQSVSLMIENITERKTIEAHILSDLREKETLIKEIHHRVKNNMQVIISLIRLQNHEMSGKQEKEAFSDLEQRISAMSYVHEELYKSHNLADINFNDYLSKISTNLISIYNKSVKVTNHIQVRNDYVNIDIAVPCGLIVNELLTNALKHAFSPKDGNMKVSGKKQVDIYFSESESDYILQVIDNGSGIKGSLDIANISSMGFHLVKIIAEEQLHGTWSIENNGGLHVTVTFPKK
jgi:two-component sensor histidine kinase/Tfp pilus assembly protein PilF